MIIAEAKRCKTNPMMVKTYGDKMTIVEAKRAYNKLLDRFNKANEYFDREDIGQAEKERYLGNYQEILRGLNYYLSIIGPYTGQEILKGFEVIA